MGSLVNKAAIKAAIELLASKYHDVLPQHILKMSVAELKEVKKGLDEIRTNWSFSSKSKVLDNLAAKRANERAYDDLIDVIDAIKMSIADHKQSKSLGALSGIERMAAHAGIDRNDPSVKLMQSIDDAASDEDDYIDAGAQFNHAPRMGLNY